MKEEIQLPNQNAEMLAAKGLGYAVWSKRHSREIKKGKKTVRAILLDTKI